MFDLMILAQLGLPAWATGAIGLGTLFGLALIIFCARYRKAGPNDAKTAISEVIRCRLQSTIVDTTTATNKATERSWPPPADDFIDLVAVPRGATIQIGPMVCRAMGFTVGELSHHLYLPLTARLICSLNVIALR